MIKKTVVGVQINLNTFKVFLLLIYFLGHTKYLLYRVMGLN